MPVISSGTFQMKIGSAGNQSGAPWTLLGGAADLVDGVVAADLKTIAMTKTAVHTCGASSHTSLAPGLHSLEFLLDNSEVVLDADPPIDYLLFPAGWVATGMTIRWLISRMFFNAGSSMVAFKVFRDGNEIWSDAADDVHGGSYQSGVDVPTDLLSAMNGPIRIEWEFVAGATVDLGCGPHAYVNLDTAIQHIYATGTYDIEAYWWTIPSVSACGDLQESHHQLVEGDDNPGAPWERLDPLDDDAAPVPTVDSVTPNHGPIAGGDSVTIDGSGFGDGCTVTFDGVAATSVVVVSQFRITCEAPANAAGYADVVVTNEDGVVSV